jgi:hypothetical protein
MRVRKNILGRYVVEDEPIRLQGKAATAFLDAMKVRDESGNTPEQTRFLSECERIYRSSKG